MHATGWIGVGLLSAGLMTGACSGPKISADAGQDAGLAMAEAAAQYRSWDRVTGPMQWAPMLCREPPSSSPRFSESPEGTIHGRKLFHLYASDLDAYTRVIGGRDDGRALALVKEVRLPIVLPGSGDFASLRRHDAAGIAVSPEDGRRYTPGEVVALFVMSRSGEVDRAGTDDGWVYGVVDGDGQRVIEAGVIASCVECHRQAPHGRVFGVAP